MGALLAVDLGIKTGLALYGETGQLLWYRSHNYGRRSRLKRGVHTLLDGLPYVSWLVIEGGGPLARIWQREAERRGIRTLHIQAEAWRERFFYQRQHRSGEQAKQTATDMARRVIAWSDAARPTALRHDTAEAILIGLWGALEVGLLADLPDGLQG